ncbi:large conductance mechanosensitive channel protein MscL [Streptomyces sp. WMMC500]|uniref:large conductance mechanosensitive channel protein MscL n=1 Tax=Streptomyces sp. WMMC500 TaxID=3015154 RepID=UPI00248BEC47|nr:large conductance mechanosensitive channel protein MscL [Streptomyces sp. WMMC500]WBB58785.1 large conductance mechanosensitive channel protein MscL [Streptomyces sp. WMMC500]
MSTQGAGSASESQGVIAGFKQFLMRGNVMELAVAVVVGAAFTSIVNAVVKGVINPLVGLFGSRNLDKYHSCFSDVCTTSPEGEVTKGVAILWGPVLSATLTFVVTAAVVYFAMILPMNKLRERQAAKTPVDASAAEVTEIELLTQIRDELVAQRNGPAPHRDGGTLPSQR